MPPSVSVRSGLFRVANSSWPESLHTVHIITPPMQTRPSIPVIYCRVGGEQTRRQRRDRCAGVEEEKEQGGGRGEGGSDRGDCRGGENEEGYFQRMEQVKAQWRRGAALSLGGSLSHVNARLSCQSQGFLLLRDCFLFPFLPNNTIFHTHCKQKKSFPFLIPLISVASPGNE